MTFWKWSKTAAANATADGTVNWAEGMAPSAVNDSARAMMAAMAKWRDDNSGALTTGGTSTAYTVSTNQVFDTLPNMSGQSLRVKFNAANDAAPTMNVDGLGAKSIVTAAGTVVAAGAIAANSVQDLVYDNLNNCWVLVGAADSTLKAPSGTKMLFQQTAAPTGWTKDTSHNNKALRLVNGTAGSGGSTAFTSVFTSRTIAQANLPNVSLSVTIPAGQGAHTHVIDTGGGSYLLSGIGFSPAPGTGGSGGSHTPSAQAATLPDMFGTAPLGGSGTALDFAVQYVDVIIATRD